MTDRTLHTGSVARRAVRWAVIGAMPVVAALIACFATRGNDEPAMPAEHNHAAGAAPSGGGPVMLSLADAQRIGVTYAPVTAGRLEREIRTLGQVVFDETRVTTVALKVDGWVERLDVNFVGQAVTRGTALLALYSPMFVTAQEELLLAKRLVNDVAGGAADARANAASLLSSARLRLEYWGVTGDDIAAIESAGAVRRIITLRSPVDGYVVDKTVFQGQRVMTGDVLYRLAPLDTVWVEGEVFERDLSAVRLGQVVTAELDALPGQRLRGRITFVYPTLNPDTRTAKMRVALANPELRLKPGMYATLRWGAATAATTLSVPRSAVVSTGERNLAFVRRPDGMLEPRLVEIGATTSDRVEILRGLVAGETVVASATFLLDAESNLGSLLGGMGGMPGMDMTAPKKPE